VIVLKFGGTSVGDAEAIARTGRIVATRADQGAVVVVSALAGVTNALIALNETVLSPANIDATLGIVLKYQDDIEKIRGARANEILGAL